MRADSHEIFTRRKSRNVGVGLTLIAVVALIFAVTLVKLGSGIVIKGFDHTFETTPGALNP